MRHKSRESLTMRRMLITRIEIITWEFERNYIIGSICIDIGHSHCAGFGFATVIRHAYKLRSRPGTSTNHDILRLEEKGTPATTTLSTSAGLATD